MYWRDSNEVARHNNSCCGDFRFEDEHTDCIAFALISDGRCSRPDLSTSYPHSTRTGTWYLVHVIRTYDLYKIVYLLLRAPSTTT